jgi:hypothetical protein
MSVEPIEHRCFIDEKTTKISGASVNLTTASVHRLIKPMNKTTHGSSVERMQL